LQGTQDPTHKSQPCKRAAIANTRQTAFKFDKKKNHKEKKESRLTAASLFPLICQQIVSFPFA
jgi:hypothetical protein